MRVWPVLARCYHVIRIYCGEKSPSGLFFKKRWWEGSQTWALPWLQQREGRLSLESRQGSRDVCRDSASLVLKGKMWKEKSSFWDEWGRCLTCPLGNHPVCETKGKRALHFQELRLWRHRMFTNPWRGGSGSSAHSLCWPSTPQIGSGFTRLINNHGGERNHFTICKSP